MAVFNLPKTVIIGIWVSRFEFYQHSEKTFGSYQSAWDYIFKNNLPATASPVEIYNP